jgi:predicted chitinase/peptidoglycan hydrolase-like protein with peptidoglycan-binding domain
VALTVDTLVRCGVPRAKAEAYLPLLTAGMREFNISTQQRGRIYLAQLLHESAAFKYFEEIASGAAYEGRRDLGNVRPGDGRRYKGRGPIQLTGRRNYTVYGHLLGVDLVNHPRLAARPKIGFRTAAAFFQRAGCNQLADKGDFIGVTRRINGGTNGLPDRQRYYRLLRGRDCTPGKPGVSRGDEGDAVEVMTRRLSFVHSPKSHKPYLDGKRRRFGAKAEAALKRFQREHGLKPTGVYDPDTQKALARSVAFRRKQSRRRRRREQRERAGARETAAPRRGEKRERERGRGQTTADLLAELERVDDRRDELMRLLVERGARLERVVAGRRALQVDELRELERELRELEGAIDQVQAAIAQSRAGESSPKAPAAEQGGDAAKRASGSEEAEPASEETAGGAPDAPAAKTAAASSGGGGNDRPGDMPPPVAGGAPDAPEHPEAPSGFAALVERLDRLDREEEQLRKVLGEHLIRLEAEVREDGAEPPVDEREEEAEPRDAPKEERKPLRSVPGVTYKVTSPFMKSREMRRFQRRLNQLFRKEWKLENYRIDADGEYGPKTRAATERAMFGLGIAKANFDRTGLTPEIRRKIVKPATRTAKEKARARRRRGWIRKLRKRYEGGGAREALAFARRQIGTAERGGANRGPKVDKWNRMVGTPLGPQAYWCGAFCNACLVAAGFTSQPWMKSCIQIEQHARGRWGGWSWHSSPKPGDMVLYGQGAVSTHVGIVERVESSKVITVEGNTSPEGGGGSQNNGGGVWRRHRSRRGGYRIRGYARPPYVH